MPYTKIEAKFENGDPIKMLKIEFGTSYYAAGPCDVYLGLTLLNAKEKAFAVMYYDGNRKKLDKFITTRTDAITWLSDRWLNRTAADLLLDLALVVCTDAAVAPVEAQVVQGDYREQLEKIRDAIAGAVDEGTIPDRRALRERVCDLIDHTVYLGDYEMGLVALRYCGDRRTGAVRRLVKTAMYDDVMQMLFRTEQFGKLPKKRDKK